ncbi:MAG TPA: glycosyltransferase [Mesotoga infera]|uniref:Glycosyltransferase n=1 Tax=Mesotoga infera TaxID=1236046 RepID=A0A7C1CUF1_9BACT|nr:glycosyltransferase [Mesotoga infera]
MKVCHITTVHPALDARIFYNECQSLSANGYDVALIAPGERDFEKSGVRVLSIKRSRRGLISRIVMPWRAFCRALREKAAIYHFHDPDFIFAALFMKLLRKKVVYDVHEHYVEVIPARKGRKPGRPYKAILKFVLETVPSKAFDMLVFPTESLSEEYGGAKRKIVIKNLFRLDSLEEDECEINVGKKYDVIHLGTVSQQRMKFMLDVIFHLSQLRKDFSWVFVGLSAETIKWVESSSEYESILGHLVLMEKVEHMKALELVKLSSVGFNYHPFEKRFQVSIPMKVFEYMAYGLAVVSTSLPELSLLLTDQKDSILVESQNAEDYAIAINNVLDDSDQMGRISVIARQTILERLNWEMSEEPKLLHSYSRILGGN